LRIFCLALLIVLASLLGVIEEYFINYELSENLAIQSILLKYEIEILNVSVCRLILFLVKLFKEWMLQSLFCAQSFRRIIA
jgi:hypothetical protein